MYILLTLLLSISCNSQCLNYVKDINDLKEFKVEYRDEFRNLVDELKKEDRLIIFINDDCIYINRPILSRELQEVIYENLTRSRNLIVSLIITEEAFNNYKLLETAYSAVRKSYIKKWNEQSLINYDNKPLTDLSYCQKAELFNETPSNLELRLDHIPKEKAQEIFDKLSLQLTPINPLLLEKDTRGVNEE